MSTADQSPKTEAPASAAQARDLVPYTPPPPKSAWDSAGTMLASGWFRGGCVVAAIAIGGVVGFLSIEGRQARLASAHAKELQDLAAHVAALRQTVLGEAQDRKQTLSLLQSGIEQMQRASASALLKVSSDLDKANAARAAAETRLAERLDRLEKQMADPAPTASVPAQAPAVSPRTQAAPASAAASRETSVVPMSGPVRRPDIPVRGYVLRGVDGKLALVETRFGLREVQLGQVLPGAGRVQSIEKRAGKWVVVTSEGIIDGDLYR